MFYYKTVNLYWIVERATIKGFTPYLQHEQLREKSKKNLQGRQRNDNAFGVVGIYGQR